MKVLSTRTFHLLFFFVSGAISARFPVGIILQTNQDLGESSNQESTKDVDFSSLEESSLEDYYEFEPDGGDKSFYVTDVQISEIQNAQDNKVKQDQEAYVIDPRCPKFDGSCIASTCVSDKDCENKICCYNGCVHTCVDGVNGKFSGIDLVQYGDYEAIFNSVLPSNSSDIITIPGGCKMTDKQSYSLEQFFKFGHITKCVCIKGDVLCYVKQRSQL